MKKALANIGIIVIVIVLMDIYLNKAGIVSLSEYEFNPKTGISYRDMDYKVIFNEGFSIKSYNRKELYSVSDSTNSSFKIALIGDSYVKADQVFNRQHFGQIMKSHLNLNSEVKVINYGYNGSDLKQMYATQKFIVDPTDPDLILYFLSNQDFSYNKFIDPLLPQVDDSGNNLNIINEFEQTKINSYKITSIIKQNSSIVNLLLNSVKHYKEKGLLPALAGKFYSQKSSLKHNQLSEGSKTRKNLMTKTPPTIEQILKTIDESKVIFVSIDQNKLSSEFTSSIRENNIRLIELNPLLDSLLSNQINPYYWKVSRMSGHWNKKAHQEIGIYLASELKKILSTTKPKTR